MQGELTVRGLVEQLGSAVLRLAAESGRPGSEDRVLGSVSIHDPGAEGAAEEVPGAGGVVLGVGLRDHAELRALAERAAAAGVHALAVKGPLPDPWEDCPLPVIEVNPGASWLHIATTVRELLLDRARSRVEPAAGPGDLFGLAQAIGSLLGAPVTIEDPSSAVLAWSSGQDGTDPGRIETVLGRAVKRERLEVLNARGDFARLRASEDPVFIEPVAPGMLPRVAIAIRAGSEVIGYVWAVASAPLPPELSARLRELTPMVALHLMGARADRIRQREYRRELAAAVLGGGAAAADAAARLRLDAGPLCVLAAAPRWEAEAGADPAAAASAARRQRFEDELDRYLSAMHPSGVALSAGATVYAVLAWPQRTPEEAEARSRALAADFLERSPAGRGFAAAVGGPAAAVGRIPTALRQADAVLRVLCGADAPEWEARGLAADGEPVVATVPEAMLPVLLNGLADRVRELGLPAESGPVRRLRELDGRDGRRGVLGETLAAYFAAGGNTEAAAERLRIHVNTMRYRLRRIREAGGLDFADADAMLLAQLQLRMGRAASPEPFGGL
ncbi:PucR family transcriptional regulator [Phaeacidiphilus oryzae]|uniref:PucR family transcriptional regulator n=1 Tax=Phaeacidiphilus oryzae TaxID=348818 RepID=UPI0005641F90|nr:helix-turn-helix domain-containing protein [Phaeacidiphilus oryzae]